MLELAYHTLILAQFGHTEARLGYYQGEPFILGSDYPSNKKAEVYRQESDKWETLPDFPFAKENIIHYGIASSHGRVLIFGGIYDGHLSDDVVAYSQYGWSKIGKLKTINFQMTAIEVKRYLRLWW